MQRGNWRTHPSIREVREEHAAEPSHGRRNVAGRQERSRVEFMPPLDKVTGMPAPSAVKQDMIDTITSIDETWPITLLYLAPNGADMKIQAGRDDNRVDQQLTLAALYLLFLEEQLDGDLREIADRVAAVAERMRADDDIGELHWGGTL